MLHKSDGTKIKRTGLTSVQIRPQIAKALSRLAAQFEISKSELINRALREYLVDREFQQIRERMAPYAQAKGLYTDEDVEQRLK